MRHKMALCGELSLGEAMDLPQDTTEEIDARTLTRSVDCTSWSDCGRQISFEIFLWYRTQSYHSFNHFYDIMRCIYLW
jgi:hypothetical protein